MPLGLGQFQEAAIFSDPKIYDSTTGTALTTFEQEQKVQWRMDHLYATNDDVIAHVIELWYSDQSTDALLGSAIIAAGAGTAGAPSVDLLVQCLPASQDGLLFYGGNVLKIRFAVAITATHHVYLTGFGGNF